MSDPRELSRKYPGLVWSNPGADDGTYIRAALVNPRFATLLEMASEFGLDRLKAEWAALNEEPEREVIRARAIVERILRNIEMGFASVSSGH